MYIVEVRKRDVDRGIDESDIYEYSDLDIAEAAYGAERTKDYDYCDDKHYRLTLLYERNSSLFARF